MLGEPFIPEMITVHLGAPDSNAENVTIPFPDYVKNVASSEIFPTWPENSLRANIYVIVTYALNRIYTEWYRSKGYNFDITNTTQYDQAFVEGREIFENVGQLVDELFNDYLRKQGNVEPFFSAFCNGTTSTCAGLSQWGTVSLAEQGYSPYNILVNYYGDNIEIVKDAPVKINAPSYPGFPVSLGMSGDFVSNIQTQLNRISRNYPKIPKVPVIDGIFDETTQDAVKTFQGIFNMTQTGIVDSATWYRIAYIYNSVKRLSELNSEGLALEEVQKQYSDNLKLGNQNKQIEILQYYLAVIGAYYERIQPVDITGFFGASTEASVKSFQRVFGLPETGIVDKSTWYEIYSAYDGIVQSVPISDGNTITLYPNVFLKEGVTSEYVKILQEYLSFIHNTYPDIPNVSVTGYFGPMTKASVIAIQKKYGLPPNGVVGAATWNRIATIYSDLYYGSQKQPYQFPGYTIK